MEEVPLHEDLRGEWGAQLRDRCLQDRGESPGSRSGGRLPVRERSPRPCLSFGDSIQGSQQGPLHLGTEPGRELLWVFKGTVQSACALAFSDVPGALMGDPPRASGHAQP